MMREREIGKREREKKRKIETKKEKWITTERRLRMEEEEKFGRGYDIYAPHNT
jgi:hypothetical protein